MSESEKKKRKNYRKNREKWIFAQSVIIAVVTLAVIISAIVSYQLNEKYYIGYNEGGSIDYNVFLKENEFYDSPYLEKDQSYVASLIDNIIADFNYVIDMDTDDVNYRYSYSITSRLEIIDDTSNVPIYNPKYDLVNVQNKSQNSSNRLEINEIVVLNYDEYNELANKFLGAYSLTKTTSNIIVRLEVDVLSDCNAFTGSSVENYSSELRIPLTSQTVNIEMKSTVPDAENKMIACTRGAGSEVFKTTAIVLGIVDILLILLLVAFIYLTRTEDITYTARVKRILSQYKSYIQKINNLFDPSGYQIIMVNTFDEMLEIRDTIQAPILMHENEHKTCAKFMIPTDSKLLYLYEIKLEGYAKPQTVADEKPSATAAKPSTVKVMRPTVKIAETPTQTKTVSNSTPKEASAATVTKPNVVRVVRPTVKVVEATGTTKTVPKPVAKAIPTSTIAKTNVARVVRPTVKIVEATKATKPEPEVEIVETVAEDPALKVIEATENSTAVELVKTTAEETEVELIETAEVETQAEVIETAVEETEVEVVETVEEETEAEVIETAVEETYTEVVETAEVETQAEVIETAVEETEVEVIETVEEETEAEVIETAVEETDIEVVETVEEETEVEVIETAEEEPEVEVIETAEEEIEVEVIETAEEESEVEVIETAEEETEVEVIETAEVETRAEVIETVEEETEAEVIETAVEETYTEVVETAEEETEVEVIETAVEETDTEVVETAKEETDPEVEELLASIPEQEEVIDDENTVEAIDIFWQERNHKTYRYDPDGNEVEVGDVVLVPTRDHYSDKNVVREAEVARGNYKIDPATLDHPLKKIIGVVRRKAEQVFTAIITPDDEKEEN